MSSDPHRRPWYLDSYGLVNGWLIVAAGVVGILAIAVGGIYTNTWLDGRSCDRFGRGVGLDVEYRPFFGGCYVELEDGRRVPSYLYRFNEEAK